MGKDITILIAEDERGHFILIRNYLHRAGFDNEIIWFKDGQQTLDFFRNRNVQYQRLADKKYILLLDIRMPKVNGLEVLSRIRQSGNGVKNTPVVIVSTSNDPQIIHQCRELGCIAYIVKPFIEDEALVEAVNNARRAV